MLLVKSVDFPIGIHHTVDTLVTTFEYGDEPFTVNWEKPHVTVYGISRREYELEGPEEEIRDCLTRLLAVQKSQSRMHS